MAIRRTARRHAGDLSGFAPGAAQVAENLRQNAAIQLAASLAGSREPSIVADRLDTEDGEFNYRKNRLDKRVLTQDERLRLPEAELIIGMISEAIKADQTANSLARTAFQLRSSEG